MSDTSKLFIELLSIVDTLRTPGKGCPWDLEQTHKSLLPYFVEETYEAIEAISESDDAHTIEELGDVLFQILIHSQIAKEEKRFSIQDVLQVAIEKLIRRHPHVFGDVKVSSVEDVLENWYKIKDSEKNKEDNSKPIKEGVLSGVPRSLPALLKAEKMGAKAAKIGLDWIKAEDVLLAIKGELEEFLKETGSNALQIDTNKEAIEMEFGDILFAIAQYARKLGISSEECLQKASSKFYKRVSLVEDLGFTVENKVQVQDLDTVWNRVKQQS